MGLSSSRLNFVAARHVGMPHTGIGECPNRGGSHGCAHVQRSGVA